MSQATQNLEISGHMQLLIKIHEQEHKTRLTLLHIGHIIITTINIPCLPDGYGIFQFLLPKYNF